MAFLFYHDGVLFDLTGSKERCENEPEVIYMIINTQATNVSVTLVFDDETTTNQENTNESEPKFVSKSEYFSLFCFKIPQI